MYLKFVKYSTQIELFNDRSNTTGEIKARPYKTGLEKRAFVKINSEYKLDQLPDDISLIIKGKDGLIVVLGCAHAGILNILHTPL